MKVSKLWVMAAVAAGCFGWTKAQAGEGNRLFHVENTLGLRYTDNVNNTATNKQSSAGFSDRITLSLDRQTDAGGFVGLRYSLTYVKWENRHDDDTDIFHAVDVNINRVLTPSLTLDVVDTFTHTPQPELINDDGTIRRPDSTYNYNTLNGTLTIQTGPRTSLGVSGRWQMLRYDEKLLAEREDYDIYSAGLTLSRLTGKNSSVFGEIRYEEITYTDALEFQDASILQPGAVEEYTNINQISDRSSKTWMIGAGVDHVFGPTLMGKITAGYMFRDLQAANEDSKDAPYVEGQLTYLAGAKTSLTLAGGYSIYQSGLISFASQTRNSASLTLRHTWTRKVTVNLTGAWISSDYEDKLSVNLLDAARVRGGTEEAMTVSAGADYALNRSNSLTAGVQYSDFSSDVEGRADYDRTIYNLGWRYKY